MYSPETGGEDPGMVADGTKCGDDMVRRRRVYSFSAHCNCSFSSSFVQICLNQTCINFRPLKSYTRCPADSQNIECSGRGVRELLTRGRGDGRVGSLTPIAFRSCLLPTGVLKQEHVRVPGGLLRPRLLQDGGHLPPARIPRQPAAPSPHPGIQPGLNTVQHICP